MVSNQIICIAAIAGAAGYFAGVAHADFIVTWKQRRHISVDAVFLASLSLICATVALIFFPYK